MADKSDCNGSNTTAASEKEQRKGAKNKALLEQAVAEKHKIPKDEYPTAHRLLDEEIQRAAETGKASFDDRYIDLYNDKSMKLCVRIQFPTKEHPKFNFVGKLLGPKGAILRQLQEDTRCRILILGKGSMRDKAKEEEYRKSNDPKFAHLTDELHVEVSCLAPPLEAHRRMTYALSELKQIMVPDDGPGGYMEEPMMPPPIHGLMRRPMPPPMMPPGGGSSKAMGFLEKARNSMGGGGPRRYGPAPRFDDGNWVSGAPAPGGRRMYPRPAPY